MSRLRVAAALLLFLLTLNASADAARPLRILFIGNSLTYTNDLPAMVQRIGAVAGRELFCQSVALPDFSLQDHLRDGGAQAAIRKGNWDWVVVQQGPSARPASRTELAASVAAFRKLLSGTRTQLAVLSVWPPVSRIGEFDDVTTSHRQAALAVKATLIPAGTAWRIAWKSNDAFRFHQDDGFHPSPLGSWATAMTVVEALVGSTSEKLTSPAVANRVANDLLRVGKRDLEVIRDAVRQAVAGTSH